MKIKKRGGVYSDVSGDDWYFDSVVFMRTNGYMTGVSENEFAPTGVLTRGMFAEILYRYADGQRYLGENSFEDVADDAYYTEAVGLAKTNGIIEGVSETEFMPETTLTRESAAAILCRFAEYKKLEMDKNSDLSVFDDGTLVSDWAYDSVSRAVDCGLMNGRSETQLAPQGEISRAEAASLIQRLDNMNN